MALNVRIPGETGMRLVARLEQMTEPGKPRLYWDEKSSAWSEDPSARLTVAADPGFEGMFLCQIPTTLTASWPDKRYSLVVLAPAEPFIPSRIHTHISVWMAGGDDGSSAAPSADIPLPDGRIAHVFGAYIRAK